MISPHAARELALCGNAADQEEAEIKLDYAVNTTAKDGKFECWLYPPQRLIKVAREIAIRSGYKVEIINNQMDGDSIHLSWGE